MAPTPITIARGDGIGPEIMEVTLSVLEAAKAAISIEEIKIGEQLYREGYSSGIKPEAWESLRRTKVLLKSPITTPQGGGVKSLNVTMRTTLGLYANVRPCQSFYPFVRTKHPKMDLVIVRENEEDLYTGIEHRQTEEVYQTLKLISRPGSERIIRYAFEYARANSRKKVSCFIKDNIMKLTDGMFHQVFDEIGAEYSDIEKDHYIVDIGTARVADTPEIFDVIVIPNLYGDILSDIAAQIAGSVGLAGSANIGLTCSMFEAIHGSAPSIAGQGIANPSGLLSAAAMMLIHIGQHEVAGKVQNALLATLEAGLHTSDIYIAGQSKTRLSTQEFGKAVIDNLGNRPAKLPAVSYSADAKPVNPATPLRKFTSPKKELVGIDIFVDCQDRDPNKLAAKLEGVGAMKFNLTMISNRGVKVWPNGFPETFCTDHWRCRFEGIEGSAIKSTDLIKLLEEFVERKVETIKTENLYRFDGEPGYSLGAGQ